ncbi:hypothetical protein [Methylococcus mesophilus]|uniref:hypothetical protein n=1 Tax=Methylococcus mesophilus TaxID=2993564 RepID=UPI00224ADF67|nr:hypothetical protein [Methylococcus mesophilus]UZR27302.1 hypothetical protein OOT43_11205 [Methylococcus mesophilus]
MTTISETPFASLENENRLLSPVFKGATAQPGVFGFRGMIALKFAQQLSDEARPPEIKFDQVMTVAKAGESTIPFLAGVALSLEYLDLLLDVLGDKLSPTGKYFFFAGNLDISKRYQITHRGATFWVLPLDEATVYNELLELFRIEKNDLKKLDTAGKLVAVADAAASFDEKFDVISFEEGLKIMGPIRIPDNRPV